MHIPRKDMGKAIGAYSSHGLLKKCSRLFRQNARYENEVNIILMLLECSFKSKYLFFGFDSQNKSR